MQDSTAARVVLVMAPSTVAEVIAEALVDERLAACVNVFAGARSVYRWQGEVQLDEEALLVIKTLAAALPALETRLRQLHPYELPEILAIAPTESSAEYLEWLRSSVGG